MFIPHLSLSFTSRTAAYQLMQRALTHHARSLTPLLTIMRGVRGPLTTSTRCYHESPPPLLPLPPLPGLFSSRVQYTTLKEISEGFSRASISEPTMNVSLLDPLAPIKITPGMHLRTRNATRNATQRNAAPRSTTQHHAAPRTTTQHRAVPRSITQHHTLYTHTHIHDPKHFSTTLMHYHNNHEH